MTKNTLEAYNSARHIEQMKQKKEEEYSLHQEEIQRKKRLARNVERYDYSFSHNLKSTLLIALFNNLSRILYTE